SSASDRKGGIVLTFLILPINSPFLPAHRTSRYDSEQGAPKREDDRHLSSLVGTAQCEIASLLCRVLRIARNHEWPIEKHLLRFCLRYAVTLPGLLRLSLIPLEPGYASEEFGQPSHTLEYITIIYY